jgi:hypothetical protein
MEAKVERVQRAFHTSEVPKAPCNCPCHDLTIDDGLSPDKLKCWCGLRSGLNNREYAFGYKIKCQKCKNISDAQCDCASDDEPVRKKKRKHPFKPDRTFKTEGKAQIFSSAKLESFEHYLRQVLEDQGVKITVKNGKFEDLPSSVLCKLVDIKLAPGEHDLLIIYRPQPGSDDDMIWAVGKMIETTGQVKENDLLAPNVTFEKTKDISMSEKK